MSEKKLSVEELIKLGEQGDPDAQHFLYEYFSNIEGKDKETIYWLTKCAESGDHHSEALLGVFYYLGEYLKYPDYKKAVYWLKKSINESPIGVETLGECYLLGKGTSKDVIKALDLFNQALELDPEDDEAFKWLGLIYLYGFEGVPVDYKKARKNLNSASNLGNVEAKSYLAVLLSKEKGDYEGACKIYKECAEEEDPRSQGVLGFYYLNGKGVNKNVEEGIKWLEKSALNGYQRAIFTLYNLYKDGKLVEKDLEKAKQWLIKGAEFKYLDFTTALIITYLIDEKDVNSASFWADKILTKLNVDIVSSIGYRYLLGRNVDKDVDKAIKYFNAAANRGDIDSMSSLGDIYSDEEDKNHFDIDKAIEYYTLAADRGDIDSMIEIGYIYYVYKNDAKNAKIWFLKAKDSGSIDALDYLGDMSFELNKFNDAKQFYEELVKRKPKNNEQMKEANYRLAQMLAKHKNIKDQFLAKDYLENALSLGQEDEDNMMSDLDTALMVDEAGNNNITQMIDDLLKNNIIPASLPNEVDNRIKTYFKESYQYLKQITKINLRTSILNFYREEQLGTYGEDQDYSYLVNSLGKAVESELKEVFHVQYLKYLKDNNIPPSSFKVGSQKFVTLDKATNKVKYVEDFDEGAFSLGTVKSHIGLVPYKEVDNHFLNYFKLIIKDGAFANDKKIIDYLSNLTCNYINHFAFNLRNPASHPSDIMPKWKAIHCANLIFKDDNFLADLLNKIKPEYLNQSENE